jgi:ATP-dependent RNA helicase RhlE
MLPKERQNLFFSATMPKEIAGLASALLTNPVRVEVAAVATTVEKVNQNVIHVDPGKKLSLLTELLKDNNMTRTLVFTRTKHGADKVMKGLSAAGFTAAAIHGNKSQANREKALAGFKQGKILVLVATDIAARGIDVDAVSHVVNYDLPYVPESYVHRIGRTARAGAEGTAIALCTPEERGLLRDIERTIRQAVPVMEHTLGLANVQLGQPDRHKQTQRPAQGAKRPHRGQGGAPKKREWNPVAGEKPQGENRNRNHGGGNRPHGAAGAQAPKRSGGKPSWMKDVGNRAG